MCLLLYTNYFSVKIVFSIIYSTHSIILVILFVFLIFRMTIDFYYTLGSPPCRSVLLTAKALGLELNLKPLELHHGEHLKPEFVKVKFIINLHFTDVST